VLESFWRILTPLVSSNLGTKVVSVIIAAVLWFVVLGSRNVEVTKEIPLELITPAEVVPANDIPEKISFRLSGPKAFLRAILDRREDPIRVNLSGAKPGLVTYRFFSDNIRLPIGVKVQSISPTAILIKLENQKRRDVPVRVELRGIPPEGYRITRTEVTPPVIRIKGAETRVDAVTEIATVPIDVSTLRETMDREVPLEIARHNVQVDGPLPRVLVEVDATAANYRIRNVEVRVLTNHKYTIDRSTVTVLVRAAPKDIKSLDKRQVYAVVDLRGRPKGKYTEPVKVQLPDNVGLDRVTPETVSVSLY
jgi:YbbR domain-containing protein